MPHPLKLAPGLLLGFALLLLLLSLVCGLPTINQGNLLQNSYASSGDKSPLQPPELEETIEEVQRILERDPTLPRLTRGEIEELYEKVTREEYQKSMEAGDMGRADSMRALMLVLPYNTDNNTEQSLQELYTRPPVTKVIDSYTPPQPIKFITADPSAPYKVETVPVGKLDATTYKPSYSVVVPPPQPTTYHPAPPPIMYKMTPSVPETIMQFHPITNVPPFRELGTNLERAVTQKSAQRFSSHYNAKNTDFLKLTAQAQRKSKPFATTTVRPVADVLESLGIVGGQQPLQRMPYTVDDYYVAESAPQPVVSTYVPQVSDQSLAPRIKSDAYTNFKPLNIGEEIRAKPEVEGYLTRFGIVGGRKRKALKKDGFVQEQESQESEIATSKVPTAGSKSRKGASELEKLLENLQELERLNLSPKALNNAKIKIKTTTTAAETTTTAVPTTRRTTTSTTTAAPITRDLITNGSPLLVEPKKPRRRIDPHIDINFASASNKHTSKNSSDQLSKLLENLQELERLRINPENVLKTVATSKPPSISSTITKTTTTTTTTTTETPQLLPARSQTIANRFSEPVFQQQLKQLQQQQELAQRNRATQQNELQQLQRVLKQLQAAEQANARAITSTTTTTRAPARVQRPLNFALNDFSQLRKLLTDDRELERLYEQARARRPGANVQNSSSTSTTTTTTSTTKKPSPSLNELAQLQKYLAAFERSRPTTTTSSTTTTSTTSSPPTPPPPPPPPPTPPTPQTSPTPPTTTIMTTSNRPSTTMTTTSTTTPKPLLFSSDTFAQRIAAANVGVAMVPPKKTTATVNHLQLQELINRVQQLERQSNNLQTAVLSVNNIKPTDGSLPSLGFISRNVNAPQVTANDVHVPSNDFAQLQQLYQQVAQAEHASFGRIEISTAATAAKTNNQQQQQEQQQRKQTFAQRIIDITNDTGSGSSLQEVQPHDFVQLQKLLRKVQELERVKILPDALGNTLKSQPTTPTTYAPSLVTAASMKSANEVPPLNAAHIVYSEKPKKQQQLVKLAATDFDDLKLELPVYQPTTAKPTAQSKSSTQAPTSSEELRELILATPAHPQSAASYDDDFEQYQQFFSKLEDSERNSYKNMEPPMIQKTVASVAIPEPPRFIATRKTEEVAKQRIAANSQQNGDLAELQKLLSNAQKLEKLGITLPQQLSQQIEHKLTSSTSPTGLPHKYIPAARPGVHKATQLEHQLLNQPLSLESGEHSMSSTTTKMETTSLESSEEEREESSEKTVVFSVTTMRSQSPKTPRPTSESTLELPIVSYQKVIEAAVRQAASKYGFSTEHPQGFRRRSDTDIYDMAGDEDDDMLGEFSELNYQLAIPDVNHGLMADISATSVNGAADGATDGTFGRSSHKAAIDVPHAADITKDLSELQRLIGNLRELQRLNLTVSPDVLRKADAEYLASFKKPESEADGVTKKNRRQSATPSTSTAVVAEGVTSEAAPPTALAATEGTDEESEASEQPTAVEGSTTTAPTRVSLDLTLSDSDADKVTPAPSEISAFNSTISSNEDSANAASDNDSATEESRNGSLADLEASFGPDPNTESPPPPKKKNGFYFLADWNSFLEVGDGDDQVVVRFSPKIGDPRLFIPVKVP